MAESSCLLEVSEVPYQFNLSVISFQDASSVMPTTNAVNEQSASTVRRVNTYLRSTMTQLCLLVFHFHTEERTDTQQLTACLNDFVSGGKHRSSLFGTFGDIFSCMFQCLPQMKLVSEKPPEAVLEGVIFLEVISVDTMDQSVDIVLLQ